MEDGQRHLREGNPVCLLCENLSFPSQSRLASHLSVHVSGPTFICSSHCNKKFADKNEAINHLRAIHCLIVLACEDCGAMMDSEKSLVRSWLFNEWMYWCSYDNYFRMYIDGFADKLNDLVQQRMEPAASDHWMTANWKRPKGSELRRKTEEPHRMCVQSVERKWVKVTWRNEYHRH